MKYNNRAEKGENETDKKNNKISQIAKSNSQRKQRSMS